MGKVATSIALLSVVLIVGSVALQVTTSAEAKTAPLPLAKQMVGKVAGVITTRNKTAQGTISSLRRPTCQGRKMLHVGVLTMALANNRFIKFRIDCADAYPATLQVGDTVKIGYQGSGLIREVVSRIIWLGQRHDRPLNLRIPSTDVGTGESSGDCPQCGNSESGKGNEGS